MGQGDHLGNVAMLHTAAHLKGGSQRTRFDDLYGMGRLSQPHPVVVINVDLPGIRGLGTVLEYLEFPRLMELMAGAEALLFPSVYEGFGFPPIEAMSLGVPTVVSDRGSLPEVTGDASMVVDIDRDGSLAEAIHRLVSEEGLAAELRAKGLEHWKQFTWDRCAKGTVEVYEGLAAR